MLTSLQSVLLEHPVAMKKSLIIILAFALFNCGCSTIGLVYRNGDWYLQHKINGYTSFNAQQKEVIRKEVSNYMLWHNKEALPEYINFLQNLNGSVQYDSHLRVEEVTLLRAHLMSLYRKTLMPAIRPFTQLLLSLDSQQVQKLGATIAKDIKKQKQDELDKSHDNILDKRADKTIDFLEWLAGDLSDEQVRKVKDISRHLPVVNHIYIQQREANQVKLIAMLNDHAGAEDISAFLSNWFITPDAARPSQHQRVIQSFEMATDEMIVQIHGILTAQQKDHMRKLITSYIKDMQILSADKHAASGNSTGFTEVPFSNRTYARY